MEKSVENTLLGRRSIRRYERQPISDEDLQFIRDAIRNTPTSYNGQQFSVIEVSDQDIKLKLEDIVGQKQMKTSARVFVFLSDYNKIAVAAKAKNLDNPGFERTTDGAIVGIIDASLAMMSAIVAAVSRGLGVCPIGYARTADPEAISALLGLPQGVFVVCALAVGVPAEMPDMKPKQPEDLLIFNNQYGCPDMAEKLIQYDHDFTEYHRTRSSNTSEEDWIGEILGYYREGMNYSMLKALQDRGYLMIS
ncbi:MAG: nitroreductase family protein [Lachnoclostridium sp.]|nr:nitroreductase family protein [Lachnoclostridium sp.]